jgi:tripartite-type tricarboxylate transporter receptor subunit TctC
VQKDTVRFKFAGGSPAAGHFSCAAKKSNPKKGAPNTASRSAVREGRQWLRPPIVDGALVAAPANGPAANESPSPPGSPQTCVITCNPVLPYCTAYLAHFVRSVSTCLVVASTALCSFHAFAQEKYPSKVIRILTAAPGSNHDWGARVVAQELTPRIGQRVIVENRGAISSEIIAKDTPPDGYTLLFYGAYTWLQPLLAKANWDPVEDLAPISLVISSPNVLVVHPSLPVKSTKELIALAKARPGALNYSAGGGGSSQHIAAELFNYLAQVKIVRVNYKGAGPSILGLITGEVQVMFAALGPIMPHVKSGKARALAVTTSKATTLARELPLIADVLPGYVSESAIGLFAPKKTPATIIKLLASHVQQGVKAADPQIIANNGVEVVASSPEEFARFIAADRAKMGEVIKSGSFSN